MFGSLLHGSEIEGPGAVPDEGSEGGRADGLGGDAVLVGLAAGAVAGMEIGGDFVNRHDANAGRQDMIEGALEIGCGDRRREGDAGYLSEGVDTGVGPARALGEDGFAGDA